jgi:hypothetical protein
MKNLVLILLTLSLLAIAGGTVARAQVIAAFKADIPFGFTVRNIRLPAGSYTIKRLNLRPDLMEIRDAEGNNVVFFSTIDTHAAKASEQPELIFNRLGEQYFLSRLFDGGNSTGAELLKSRAEKRLKREIAAIEVTVPARSEMNAKH